MRCIFEVGIEGSYRLELARLQPGDVRLYFEDVLLDEMDTIAQVGLRDGGTVLVLVPKPSIRQKYSPLINLKINQIITVKIVNCYHEKQLFFVADDTAYGLPVCFVGKAQAVFDIGAVVSAACVGAKLKLDKVEYLILENSQTRPKSSFCAFCM